MKKIIIPIAMVSLFMIGCKSNTDTVEIDKDSTEYSEEKREDDQTNAEKQKNEEELFEEQVQSAPALPYKQARGYIVKKNYEVPASQYIKLESKADFDKVFIKASTIGWKGETTNIDWNKQYVIAVLQPAVEQFVSIAPTYATKQGEEIYIRYAELEGEEMTREYHPSMLLLVDKEYNGNINIKKRNS